MLGVATISFPKNKVLLLALSVMVLFLISIRLSQPAEALTQISCSQKQADGSAYNWACFSCQFSAVTCGDPQPGSCIEKDLGNGFCTNTCLCGNITEQGSSFQSCGGSVGACVYSPQDTCEESFGWGYLTSAPYVCGTGGNGEKRYSCNTSTKLCQEDINGSFTEPTCSNTCGGGGGGGEPDFTLQMSPESRTINPGDTTTFTVRLQSLNGFNNEVELNWFGCPSGTTCTFNSTNAIKGRVYLSSGGTVTDTLVIASNSFVQAGTYDITVIGQWGSGSTSITHSDTKPLNVLSALAINNALCKNFTAPAEVLAGKTFSVSAVMENNGTNTWVDSTQSANRFYGLTVVPWKAAFNPATEWTGDVWNMVSGSVPPNSTATFVPTLTAPTTPGTYTLSMQMLQQNVSWFGGVCQKTITVLPDNACVSNVGQSCSTNICRTGETIQCDGSCGGGTPISNCVGGSTPKLDVQPLTLSFSAKQGEPAPAAQNVTVKNIGGGQLEWTARTDQDWCRANGINSLGKDQAGQSGAFPSGGPLSTGQTNPLAISVDAPSNTGTYNCNVTVTNKADASDTKTVTVTYTVTTTSTPPPDRVFTCNDTNSCPGGGGAGSGVQCSQVKIIWDPATGSPTGYKIYRSSSNPGSSGFSESSWQLLASVGPGVFSAIDSSPLNKTSDNYYAVTAVFTGGESAKILAPPITPIACEANLSASDKDIIGVNNTTFSTNDCRGSETPPVTQIFRLEDIVGFAINMCNNETTSQYDASNVVVTDTLLNLDRAFIQYAATDGKAWNARVNGAPINPSSVSGIAPNQTLVFNIPGKIPKGSVKTLTFQARLALPPGYAGNFARFQNQATIVYTKDKDGNRGSKTVQTPLIRFYTSKNVPERQEIAP